MNSAATSHEKILLTAAWVAPMDRPIIRDGGVVFADGTIVAVGDAKELRAAHPDAQLQDLGASIVLPGLVNAHTHLELFEQRSNAAPESFVAWLLQVMSATPLPDATGDARVHQATQMGILASLRYGVTCAGDISRRVETTRRVLKASPMRATSYGEVTAMAARRSMLDFRIDAATAFTTSPGRLQIGISPHAPYSIEESGYRRCLERARRKRLPLTTHLAESPDEARFLSDHDGPFRQLWQQIGGWDDRVPTFHGGPIRFARSIGLLDYEATSLAHVNYCDDDELTILAAGKASIVYCPRTHKFFNHPPHRWREMLSRGINVAVGTDSCASSPDLNIVDDLRLLHEIAPEFAVEELWQMATTRAAKAIGMEDVAGSISEGKAADLVAFEATTNDPLTEILATRRAPKQLWISGQLSS